MWEASQRMTVEVKLRKGVRVALKYGGTPALLFFLCFCSTAAAAVNCVLDHPDQDVKRLFPQSTYYRVRDLFWGRHASAETLKLARKEIPIDDSPKTFYAVYDKSKMLGLIYGRIYEGKKGTNEVFVAYEKNGKIKDIYFQKFEAKDAPYFRSKYYRRQFKKYGISLVLDNAHILPPVRMPSPETLEEHQLLVKSLRENVLTVKYLYNQIH